MQLGKRIEGMRVKGGHIQAGVVTMNFPASDFHWLVPNEIHWYSR